MNHVPPSVRAALQRRNRQDILDKPGEYMQFKKDIYEIIHGDDQGTQRNEDVMIPDFEDDISPEEKKVDKAVEGYAAKHSKSDARPNHNKLLDMELDDDKVKLMARKYIGEDKLQRLAEQNDLKSIDDLSTEDMLKYMSDDDIADMMVANGYDEIDLDEDGEALDISDDEISEALADYQWQITDKTTVADYARETAEKLGVDKDRVLDMIKSESPNIKDTDKMSKVAGLDDEEPSENDKAANQIKPKYPHKDFGNLRYYPTESRMEGSRYVGRHHSIHDAFGLDDFYRGESKQEPYKGTSIVQLPDGYFSINPNITSMSFKTRKDLEDYLDHEYDDDYRNYDFKDDIQVMRKTPEGDDEEPVDAYIRAKTKQSEQADRESVAKAMRESLKIPGDEVESILKGMNKESYEKLLKWIKTPRD